MSQLGISGTIPVLLEMEGTTEEEVIREMIRSLEGRGEVRDAGFFVQAVLERQKVHPPLLGNGVALPHARTSAVTEMVLVIGKCRASVAFGPEQIPVKLIFLYGVPAQCISEYLASVARLTGFLRQSGCLDQLLMAADETSFRALLP